MNGSTAVKNVSSLKLNKSCPKLQRKTILLHRWSLTNFKWSGLLMLFSDPEFSSSGTIIVSEWGSKRTWASLYGRVHLWIFSLWLGFPFLSKCVTCKWWEWKIWSSSWIHHWFFEWMLQFLFLIEKKLSA